jgi:hypothetical protein
VIAYLDASSGARFAASDSRNGSINSYRLRSSTSSDRFRCSPKPRQSWSWCMMIDEYLLANTHKATVSPHARLV